MRKSKGQKFLRTADIMAVLGIMLLLGAHFVTQVAIWSMRDYGGEIIAVAQAFEANPAAMSLLTSASGIATMISYVIQPAILFAGYYLVISYVIQPAILFAGYYLVRRKFVQADNIVVLFWAAFLFFSGLTNFLNDFGALVGLMM